MKKILILSQATVGKEMTALGIRNYEIAKALSDRFDVTLLPYKKNIKHIIQEHDIILAQEFKIRHLPFLYRNRKKIILDVYAPFNIESFELFSFLEEGLHDKLNFYVNKRFSLQFKYMDLLICANEKQCNYWIGVLNCLGVINNKRYESDKLLNDFIVKIPFGIPETEPDVSQLSLKGKYKNIKQTDKIILWNSSIWNWLDPITLIKAFSKLKEKYDNVKLVFLGMNYPDKHIKMYEQYEKALDLAKSLKLFDTDIFFIKTRVPYNERQNYICDADVGVALHSRHLESYFCFRSRMLDFFWAEIPIINTTGDIVSEIIEKYKLGISVLPEDEVSVYNAFEKILFDKDFYMQCKNNYKNIKQRFYWKNLITPLSDFCAKSDDKKIFQISQYFILIMEVIIFYLQIMSFNIIFKYRTKHKK